MGQCFQPGEFCEQTLVSSKAKFVRKRMVISSRAIFVRIFQGLLPTFSRVYSIKRTPFSRVKFTTVYSIYSEVYSILRLERESLRATSGEYALHALLSGGLAGDIWVTLLVTSMCL